MNNYLVIVILGAAFLALGPAAVLAQNIMSTSNEPSLQLYTNKGSYEAGDEGFVVLQLDTYGQMDSAEIEIQVLSESGKLVEGYLLYTKIPKSTLVNPETKQTTQVIYDESIQYFGPEKTIFRIINFEIPLDVPTGSYSVIGLVSGNAISLKGETSMYVTGPGGSVNLIFLAYLAVLVFSLYLIRRG